MNSQNSRPILVIQSLGLGDILFALPVLKILKRNYPGRPLVFLTQERLRELFQFIPEVDRVITYRDKSPFALFRLAGELRRQNFEMCFVLNPVFRGALAAFFSGAPVRVGYLHDYEKKQSMHGLEGLLLTHVFRPRNERLHETDRYLDLLRMFGMETRKEDSVPRFAGPRVHSSAVESAFQSKGISSHGPIVVMSPGAGWSLKCWPADRFAETGKWLAEHLNARIVLIGGESERDLNEKILQGMKVPAINLAGKTSLAELGGILSGANLLITNDSGNMHVAAALQVPTLALFGPGDPVKFKPLSEKTKILYHPMPCSPCRFQYTNRCQNNLCMKEITVEEVLQACLEMLSPGKKISFTASAALPLSKKKKILYLQATSEIGGTDITLWRTLEALDKNRYEPHVLLPKEGPLTGAYEKLGCQIHILPGMRKMTRRRGVGYLILWLLGYLPAVFRIAQMIRREKIDLVHTNTIHNLYGFLAARLAGVPHVWHVREIVVQSRWVWVFENFLVRHFSDLFIVMDNAIAETFLGVSHGFPKNIAKLYDGIDLGKFHPGISGSRIRHGLGIPEQIPLVGMVSRLDPWKGIDFFLAAAGKVHAQMPDVRFLICGGEIEGHEGYEKVLQQKAAKLGIQDRVHFTGWKYRGEDIPEVYRALTVSVQTPIFPEPYGLANIEAMASAVPIVAFDEGGPSELCAQNETAFLVPARDSEAAAVAILKLLKDSSRAQTMGMAGRHRAERLFDSRKRVKELEMLYHEILEKR